MLMSKTTFTAISSLNWCGKRLIPPAVRQGWKKTISFGATLFAILMPLFFFVSTGLYGQVSPPIGWQLSYGGTGYDYFRNMYRTSDGGMLLIGSSSSPAGLDKSQPSRGQTDFWIVKTDAAGQKMWDKTYGSAWEENISEMVETPDGGYLLVGSIYKNIVGANPNPGDISDPGPPVTDTYEDVGWIIRVDANGNKLWDRIVGETISSAIPTSDGGFVLAGIIGGYNDGDYWLTKVSSTGQTVWENQYGKGLLYKAIKTPDGGVLLGGFRRGTHPGHTEPSRGLLDYWIVKTDGAGNKVWDKTFGTSSYDMMSDMIATMDGGFLLLGLSDGGADFDKTVPGRGGIDYWVVKTDANGNKLWDNAYGSSGDDSGLRITSAADGGYYLTGMSAGIGGDRTEPQRGPIDPWILKITSSGTKVWDKVVSNTREDYIGSVAALQDTDGGIIVGVESRGPADGDKTASHKGEEDFWLFKLGCAWSTDNVVNDISPATQSACNMGTPEVLTGTDDDGLYPDYITYQWQRSLNGVDGWTDIAYGIIKDYLPEPSSNVMYYRRIARWECHADTSNIATVNIRPESAPTLSMDGPYHTCAGSPITLGMTPIATGGTAPYTYSWDNASYLNDAAAPNPLATVSSTSIFTLSVTDAAGCKKIGQAIVNVPPPALAGSDVTFCPGTAGVKLGKAPLTSIPGVNYSWLPTTGLNNPSIAQPIAKPSSTTTYTLTVSYQNSDGGACTVSDQVVVSVATPPTPGFAGPDVAICSGETAVLGIAAQAGYSYTWSPGLYLEQNNAAQVTFNPGTPFPPAVDPITYSVTATNGTCTYTDQVVASVIRADAGEDGCGSRNIGTPDLTPDVNETYTWVRLASSTGNGNFTGATNLPMVSVSAPSSGEDVYQLTVSYGGASCVSTVKVTACASGGGCDVDFAAEGGNCLLYNGKPLKLIADNGGQTGYSYTWSPSAGLSSSTGAVVYLLDNVNRNYTLTKTRIDNPSTVCSITKTVNPPAASYPVFTAPDVTGCQADWVTIGAPSVTGYTYSWTGPDGFTSSSSSSSLQLWPEVTGVYTVRVDDTNPANQGGCFAIDTVIVAIETVAATKVDWTVCENAIIKLGAPDPSGGRWTYSWSPSVAAWENGTGPSSAEPEVLITTSTTFTVTVTNETGCSATANSIITVDNNPTIESGPDILDACAGSIVQIGSPALPGVSYSWSPATGLSNPNVAQPMATVGASGTSITYTVTATFPGTCLTAATSQVTVGAFDSDFDLGSDIVYCPSAGPVHIGNNAPTTGVSKYTWTPATGLSSTSIANPLASVTVPTEYTLSIQYNNSCFASAKVKVIPSSTPYAGSDRTICYGSSILLGSTSNLAASTWSGAGSAYLSSTTGSTVTFNAGGTAPVGTYTFTVSQTANGCTNSDQVVVTVNPPVSVSPGAATLCLNGTSTLGQPAQPGYTYSWSPATGLSSPGSAITQVTLNTAGTYNYTLFVTNNATGCTGSAQHVVTVLSTGAPEVTVPDETACFATPFTLQATISPSSGNYSYEWSPATGLSDPFILNPTATVNSTQSYSLLVTDNASGCSGQASGTITVANPTGNYITSGPQNSNACANSSVTLQASLAEGYTYTLRWQKYNISTSVWEDLTDGGIYSGTTTTTLQISNNATLNGARYRLGVTTTSCGVTQQSSVATLTVNQCLKSSIGDWVWDDVDRDSLQDASEPGVAAMTVMLYRNGTVVATTTTDTDGYYLFDNLDAFDQFGNAHVYQVGFSDLPTDYVFTGQGTDAGSNGAGTATDSDVDPNTGLSRPVTLTYGQHLADVDAGVHSSKPMPVTLVSFNATGENNTAILVWSTSWESNSQGFEVQRSHDAAHWLTIGSVAAQGESSTVSGYMFKDIAPLGGSNYYRLRMVDQDGTFAFSRIVVVDFGQTRSVVSPNPANQRINLTGTGLGKVLQVCLTSQTGNEYYKGLMPKEGISLNGIQAGVYLLRVEYTDGAAETLKVLVVK